MTEKTEKFENYFLVGGLVIAFLVLSMSLGNKFVSDDLSAIQFNPDINSWKFVTHRLIGLVQNFGYFLIANVFGVIPWPFRMLNILLHLTTATLLYKIVRRFYIFLVAICSFALYVVTPVITEPVIWISGMPYVLSGVLAMSCIYLHLEEKRSRNMEYLEIIFWSMALLTSEKYIFVPVLLVLWDWYRGSLKKSSWVLVALMGISLLRGLELLSIMGDRLTSLETSYYSSQTGRENPIFKVLVAVGNYLTLYFWPKALTLYHSEVNFGRQYLMQYGGATLGFVFWIWFLRNKVKDLWFWVVFMFITITPVLLPFGVSSLVAERYGYLFYAGLAVIISLTINYFFTGKNKNVYMYLVVGMAFVAMTGRTIVRIRDWRDADTLWFAAGKYSPSSWQNHNNLGDAYTNLKNYPMAIEEFSTAIKLNPRYADAMHNRANVYWRLGDIEKAQKGYTEAFANNPRLWQSLIKLAEIEANKGDMAKALEIMKKAYEIERSEQNKLWVDELTRMQKENAK